MSERLIIPSERLHLSECGRYEPAPFGIGYINSEPFWLSPKGTIKLDGIKCYKPLWRRILVWLGFKRFDRPWKVEYRFVNLESASFVMPRDESR